MNDYVGTNGHEDVAELITRRRKQILVHSIIYYKFDSNIISDAQWSEWAMELAELQRRYPDIANGCPYAEEFKDFDGSSGYNLPLDDPIAMRDAIALLEWRD